MKVGLFIPCYVDQFYPQVGIATLQLLRRLGCEVEYPTNQACCGQPTANAGFDKNSRAAQKTFRRNFEEYDFVVCPSGSCVLYVRDHYPRETSSSGPEPIGQRTYELCEFLTDVLNVDKLDARFDRRVGLHQSCHGLRGLRLGSASESPVESPNKVRRLLEMVTDIELIDLDRSDECCGFGGTFAVTEEAVAVKMGSDRIADHVSNGAEVVTGTDMSCIMHLEGLARRRGTDITFMHVAQILNST
ncbi:MAG: (Fe-S)-binding protein [Rhodothermales bacterium]|nr:(Fe-S)-binding protein [Rhodothermales bacterium]